MSIGVLDHFTGLELLILYLAPIFLASWYAGWQVAVVVSIYSAGAALVTQSLLVEEPESGLSAAGTLIVRLASYLLISWVVARLRETMRQQRELTGFIVHDLRSPLSSAITGLMTLQQSEEHMGEVEREMVELALVSNTRALTLVNSILDVAKLETGKMDVSKESVALPEFVDGCVEQVALWAQGHGISIEKDLHLDKATLDPQLTTRILVNLLSNALKFSPEGGTVMVRADLWHHAVRFAVVDQGPGIPQEYASTIFEPFGQVKGTKGGTGLGLTFCRLAVHAQGGKIWVDSHVGNGTTMSFTIPQPHGRLSHEAHTAPVEDL